MPIFSCLSAFLTLFYFQFSKQNITINQPQTFLSLPSHDCHKQPSWDGISLFHTRQRFITIPSPSTPTTPLPHPPTVYTICICDSLVYCVQSKSLSITLTPASGLIEHIFMCACVCVCGSLCAFYVCQCCSTASHHAITEPQWAVSLLPHTGQRRELQ